jgi:hypothetical protein
MSTKHFTPEFRADANYILDNNHPTEDTVGGATEISRSYKWQLEQLSIGADIRINNVRGPILTMDGLFVTTTPCNDASPNRGEWHSAGAYKYISEGWSGYRWDVAHGLNVDAGIFVLYIGLFSYYNFDNWTYRARSCRRIRRGFPTGFASNISQRRSRRSSRGLLMDGSRLHATTGSQAWEDRFCDGPRRIWTLCSITMDSAKTMQPFPAARAYTRTIARRTTTATRLFGMASLSWIR